MISRTNLSSQLINLRSKALNQNNYNNPNFNLSIKQNYLHKSLVNKITYRLSQKDQRFLRFIDFDANYFDRVPLLLQPLDPVMIYTKDLILQANQLVGVPWWGVLMIASILIRLTIFPLIIIQMKRMSKLGPISPVFVLIKDTWKNSQLSFKQKIKTVWGLYRIISKQQKIHLSTIFIYNMSYYPILISMIFSIRKLLSEPEVANTVFLHLNNLGDIDPYYILPSLTIGLYYWNFERFITNQNKNTLISKIRIACQYFLIVWYPFLCCWPSGIVLYMCTNAMMSIFQSNLMKKAWFLGKIAPEMVFYNYMLTTVEYDKGISDTVIQSIKSGEQNFKQKAINQQILFQQTEIMIKKLNKQSGQQVVYNIPKIKKITKNNQNQETENKNN